MIRPAARLVAAAAVVTTVASSLVLASAPARSAEGNVTIVVVAGQSNASGYESYAVDPANGRRVLAATATAADGSTQIAWVQPDLNDATVGLGTDGPVPLDTPQDEAPNPLVPRGGQVFGPEIGLARGLHDQGVRNLVIVKVTQGGTSLSAPGSVWASRNGAMFDAVTRSVRAVESYEQAHDRATTLDGVYWYQGESDATNLAYAREYQSKLTQLIESLRTDLHAPGLPFVLAKESTTQNLSFMEGARICDVSQCAALDQANEVVRSADDWVSDHLSEVREVDTANLVRASIGIHLTDISELMLGRELADADVVNSDSSGWG